MRTIRAVMTVMALAVPIVTFAQATTALAKPGPEIVKFSSMMVGTWTYEGAAKANVYGPAGKISGTDVWELGPGGFSAPHRWDEKNPLGSLKGLEVISYDPARKVYTFTYFTSFGEMGSGTGVWTGNTIAFSSTGTTYEGKQAWSKCTWTIVSTATFTAKCDASADGKSWANGIFEAKWTRK